ncbi:MAG: VanW family protein [Clostridia bacterium]|nr:VanW family protein [Clostridia bacterium]
MNQNGFEQTNTRNRRSERYAGEFVSEPSMSAPQPMPGKPAATPAVPLQAPSADGSTGAFGYTQPYPAQQQAGWQQPYGGVPVQQGWSQPYPVQQPVQQGWSQPYPVQQPAQQGWSQPYPVQQPVQQSWSQPYTPAGNDWQPNGGSAGQPAGNGDGGGRKGNSKLKLILAAAGILAAIVAIVILAVNLSRSSALHDEVSAYNSRFCEGVYVDGIHLGGMTQQEAVDAVTASAQQRMQAWNIRLTYQGGLIRIIKATDLGMTVNVHDALAAAWEPGHASNDVKERKAAMDALLTEPYEGFTALPSGDTRVIDGILYDLAATVYRQPTDAYISEFNPLMHSYPFVIAPEQNGYFLDVAPIKEQISGMVENMTSGSIELTPQTLLPSVTEADIRRQHTLRGSAMTEISTMSTEGRTANIERAFEIINGTTLKPGESFSFNGIVGPRSAKNGFHLAIEYAYGNEREGYGGGVCQASTTIYLAAVRANMTITKREAHSDKVNYTAYGLDATVNLDGKKIDLTFKNTTGSNVYILTYLERVGNRWVCKVDIYGESHEEGVTYDLIAETVEILQPPAEPEYVEDKTGTHVVYIDDEPVVKRKAEEGVVVDTFQVKYLNGKEVSRTFVAQDTYKAKTQQLWVGVSEREDAWPY